MNKKGWISIIVAIFLVGGIIYYNQASSGGSKDSRPEVGFLAPDFTLKNEQGQNITLSQYKGKPIFINFWASWCPPCKVEMPFIQQAFEKYKDQVVFLGVNLTSNDSRDAAINFMKSNGYQMPILFDDNKDPKKTVGTLYRAVSIPTSYFIDKNGVIQVKHTGAMEYNTIEKDIKKILGE
ncbi:TlpA disulfide reductase family protein [Tepidibacillus marianensis]|uniref:TlpA family protein disulfide reductase n=1 Tax=Tepidibacillus marianensis TaxID=3131995 RepID=UPI0030CAD6EA